MFKSKRRSSSNRQVDISNEELELEKLNEDNDNDKREQETHSKKSKSIQDKTCFPFDNYTGVLNRRKKSLNESQIDSITDLNEKYGSSSLNLNKPQDSNFAQQNLPAWKPMLTPKFVVNLFLICSIIFIPIGIILYYTSLNIYEFKEEYTDCLDLKQSNKTCYEQLQKNITYSCTCRIHFTWNNYQDQTLFVFYMLENFYQNHRRFDKSRDHEQLLSTRNDNYLSTDCEPFRYRRNKNNKILKIAPCGSVANSMFNDTFKIFYLIKNTNESIQLSINKTNLAWDSDRKFKFNNPNDFKNTIRPSYWSVNITQLKDGYKNEDLMVWMRSSAFPTFKKLYGRILIEDFHPETSHSTLIKSNLSNNNLNQINKKRLPKGHYYVDISYKYLVKKFAGKKYFVIANESWIGGRCFFMAIMYIIVGSLCFITAVFLFLLHIYRGHMDYDSVIVIQEQLIQEALNQNIVNPQSN